MLQSLQMWLTFCDGVPCMVSASTVDNGMLLHWRMAVGQRVGEMALGLMSGCLFGRNLCCS